MTAYSEGQIGVKNIFLKPNSQLRLGSSKRVNHLSFFFRLGPNMIAGEFFDPFCSIIGHYGAPSELICHTA